MSLQGDLAVEVEMRHLLIFMDKIAVLSSEQQLEKIRKYVEEIKKSAKDGWL